jgi:hypothetical protein
LLRIDFTLRRFCYLSSIFSNSANWTLDNKVMNKPLRGLEVQLRTRARIRQTANGEALVFGFSLGPIGIFCIANIPGNEDENAQSVVYIKITVSPAGEWEIFKEHV